MTPEEERLLFEARRAGFIECEVEPRKAVGDVDPTQTVSPCDAPEEAPEEIFLPPSDAPPDVTPARNLPLPISVVAGPFSLTCPDGMLPAVGFVSPVAFAKGELSSADQLVYLDSISAIPLGELYRIASLISALEALVDSELSDAVDNPYYDWDAFDLEVVALLGVTITIAAAIRAVLAVAQNKANAIVENVAHASLRCEWSSRQLVVYCDKDAPDGYATLLLPADIPTGVDSREIDAAAARSSTSQADADARAARIAARSLICLFKNVEQTATCEQLTDDDAYALGATILWADALNARDTYPKLLHELDGVEFAAVGSLPNLRKLKLVSTIAADRVTGRTQDEADAAALAMAMAELDCFIPSRARIFSCADDDTAYGNETAHALVTEYGSEDEVLNEMVTGSIAGARQDNVGITNELRVDGTVGVFTTLPAGMFVGDSPGVADLEAEIFAISTLECRWGNNSLVYACDDISSNVAEAVEVQAHFTENYPRIDDALDGLPDILRRDNKVGKLILSTALGRNLSMLASPRRSHVYSADVAARQFFGTEGQAAVDRVAAAFVLGQLECVYCNPRIPPVCVTFLDEDMTAANVVLPLLVDDDRLAEDQSADATSGVPGVHYTNAEPAEALLPPSDYLTDADADSAAITCGAIEEVLTIADVIGVIPTRDLVAHNQRCRYGNRRMNFSCADGSADDVDFTTPAAALEGVEAYLSAASTPTTGSYFTIAENTYEAYAESEGVDDKAAAQAAADAQAEAIGLSQLDCFYESPLLHLYCGAVADPPAYDDIDPTHYVVSGTVVIQPTSDPGKKNGQIVAESSNGSYAVGTAAANRPVILRHGYAKSYVSPQAALSEAFFEGLAQLDCYFESAAIDMACGAPSVLAPAVSPQLPPRETTIIIAGDGVQPGGDPPDVGERTYAPESVGSTIRHVTVASKLFRSYESQHDANTVAYMSALDQLDCFYESRAMSASCGSTGGGGSYYLVNGDHIVYEGGGGSWSNYSTGFPEALSVARAAARSYTSQQQADAAAFVTLQAQLVCFFTNVNWFSDKCPADTVMVSAGFVGAGEFTSLVSQALADAPAMRLAEALVVCDPVDAEVVVEYWKYNEKQEDCKCGEGEDEQPAIKCGVVASGTIRAEGSDYESAQAAANGAASALAKALTQCPPWKKPPATGIHSLVASNGSVSWLETTPCDGEEEVGSGFSNNY